MVVMTTLPSLKGQCMGNLAGTAQDLYAADPTNAPSPPALSQRAGVYSLLCALRMDLLQPHQMRSTSQGTASMVCSHAGGAVCTTCDTKVSTPLCLHKTPNTANSSKARVTVLHLRYQAWARQQKNCRGPRPSSL